MSELHHSVIRPPLNETDVPSPSLQLDGTSVDVSEALTKTLRNPELARIALYIPWHWLPGDDHHEYREAYLDAWWSLLEQVDQRADFVDGDIGERNDGMPRPFVAKAAHLAPQLVRAGLLTREELEHIHRHTNGIVLRRSIDDAKQPARFVPDTVTPETIHARLALVREQADATTVPRARSKWLFETAVRSMTREAARTLSLRESERLMESDDEITTLIALRSLSRHSRHGAGVSSYLPWYAMQLEHDSLAVRRQARATFRHLYNSGHLMTDTLHAYGVPVPVLSGELSENALSMTTEIQRMREAAEAIAHNPDLAAAYFPVVLMGGSRLKGYGDEHSDVDTTVIVRPGATANPYRLRDLFGKDLPLQLRTEASPAGVRIMETAMTDATWSHLVYSTLWVGDDPTIDQLRRDLTAAYDDPALRHGALRRLEQDSLQYRLMHKGYEQHFAIEADDNVVPKGGTDNDSVFWDLGYRELATRLFIEKVRLPRVK